MSSTEAYNKLSWYNKLLINVARCGPVPQCMAFLVDGSRRFAKKNNIKKENAITTGLELFVQVIEWSFLLGVKEISIYTFSLENFKRDESEVNFMFNIFTDKFETFLQNVDFYLRLGIRFNFFGNFTLLPERLQVVISNIASQTKECKVFQVNIFVAYTSRDEIVNTIKSLIHGVENNEIDVLDIDETFFTRCLCTRDRPEVNLLLRTSGVSRLSDFLLWQTATTNLVFMEIFWPEIELWQIVYQIIAYQRSTLRDKVFKSIAKTNYSFEQMENNDRFLRKHSFLRKLTIQADQQLKPKDL